MGKKRKHEDTNSHGEGSSRASAKKHRHKHHHSSDNLTSNGSASVTSPQDPYKAYTSELNAKLPQKATPAQVPSSIPTAALSETATHSTKPADVPPLPKLSSALQDAPFTHSSVNDDKYRKGISYDRLEFLGDAYLEVIATRLIYSRFSHLPTGKLSALREKLVRNSTLSVFAKQYGFEKNLKLDRSQAKRFLNLDQGNGQHRKPLGQAHSPDKILADVFEAYVAAVILSDEQNGFDTAESWLTSLWAGILLEASGNQNFTVVENRKDELARLVGGKYVKIEYEAVQHANPKLDKQNTIVAVYLTGWGYEKHKLGQGEGTSIKEAGMVAAADALNNNREFVDGVAAVKQKEDNERRERLARERGLDGAETSS